MEKGRSRVTNPGPRASRNSTVSAEVQPSNGFRGNHVEFRLAHLLFRMAKSRLAGDGIGGFCLPFGGLASEVVSPIPTREQTAIEIPSSKRPRSCPPFGIGNREGFPTLLAARKSDRTANGSEPLKCAFNNSTLYLRLRLLVKHFVNFFSVRLRREYQSPSDFAFIPDGGTTGQTWHGRVPVIDSRWDLS